MTDGGNGQSQSGKLSISLLGAERTPAEPSIERVVLMTNRGNIEAVLHTQGPQGLIGPAAVVWVGGARGGILGPAGGIYLNLAQRLAPTGISSLRLEYREPNVLFECIADLLVALAWLEDEGGVTRAGLVGHSFGGAVVIDAGAMSAITKTVVTLSSQTYGADLVGEIGPRALLLVHGDADTVLSPHCSRTLYKAAQEPRELVIYPGAGHGLNECADALHELLFNHLQKHLAPTAW